MKKNNVLAVLVFAFIFSNLAASAQRPTIVSARILDQSKLEMVVKSPSGRTTKQIVTQGVILEAQRGGEDKFITFYPYAEGKDLCLSYSGKRCDRFLGEVVNDGVVKFHAHVTNVAHVVIKSGREFFTWEVSLFLGD